MAAPVLESGSQYASFSSTSSWSVNKPTGLAVGELILLVLETSLATGWTVSGFTTGPTVTSGTIDMATFWRVADGTEGSTFSLTRATGATGSVVAHRISGASTVGAEANSSIAVGSGTDPVVIPALTTLGTDRLLLAIYASHRGGTLTWTTPTGFTAGTQFTSSPSQQSIFHTTQASAGSTGTVSSSSSPTTVSRTGLLLAFGAPSNQTVSPSGLAVPVTFGTPTAFLGTQQTVSPSGLSIPITFGTPTLNVTVPVTGFSVPVTFGQPIALNEEPTLNYGATIPTAPEEFQDRWATGQHIGDIAPRMVVEVRRGRWNRGYYDIDPSAEIDVDIYGETHDAPWQAAWDDVEGWIEIPGVAEYSEQQSFDENGCQIVTLTLDNVRFVPRAGVTDLPYLELDRGFASPTRGATPAAGRPDDNWDTNEWYDRLARMAQVRVWQGYGDPERDESEAMPDDGGTNGMWVFMGQIDDIDLSDAPDRITVTCRNGQPLTDQEFFGWSKSKTLSEPVVFADRLTYEGEDRAARWILVDDVSEVVRIVLRWAGYLDTAIETTGVRMKGHRSYNRQNKLIEPINEICELTGYSFFFAPPLDGESLALPVFRMNGARDAAPVDMVEITEDDLLTGIEYKQSMEPLAYIIRVRGKKEDADTGGVTLGGDSSSRVMATYRPPWSYTPGDAFLLSDRLAGLLRHVTLTRPQLSDVAECLEFAKLLAFYEALAMVEAVIEIPGHPGLLLDHQVGIYDTTAAVNSRMWISGRASTFTTGENTQWRTTLTGPLLDFADVVAMLEELEA